jgi:hypothetical protein
MVNLNIFFSKKGISSVISISLLLFVLVVSYSSLSQWADSFQDNLHLKTGGDSYDLNLEILSLERVSDNLSLLVVKNPSKYYIVLDEVKLENLTCNTVYSNVIVGFGDIFIDCDVIYGNTYLISTISTLGLSSKLLSVFE